MFGLKNRRQLEDVATSTVSVLRAQCIEREQMSLATVFESYHGVTGAIHQANFISLKSQEFRPISLSSYGDYLDPLYAAVWVHRDGPPFEGFHGLSASEVQTKFDNLTKLGYALTLLSVVGPSSTSAVFSGVFEERENASQKFMSGLRDGEESDVGSFQWWNMWSRLMNLTLRCASIYGSINESLLYAAVWETNADATHWLAKTHDTEEEYVTWFNACIQLPYRPAFVTSSQHGKYLSIFKNDDVGEKWVAKHGLNGTQYQAEVERLKSQGLYPISVQGGGPSTSPRYTAIFAKQDIPTPKVFTIEGNKTVAELEHIDDVMSTFMQRHGIRAGQITVSKDGVTKLEHAYTYASPSYPVTHPSTFFRLASVSKAFACAAITVAMNANLLTLSTPVFPLLEISSPALDSQTPSPFIDTITIQHLIDHAGGWNKAESGFEPASAFREIAIALNLRSPVTNWDVARYMYGEPLQFEPGTEDYNSTGSNSYSNFGYLLLGLVIEKTSGMSFIDFVKERVMAPLGNTDVEVGRTLRNELRPDEVSYDQPEFGFSAIDFRSDLLTPYAYGGEGYITEAIDSSGGLIATATAVTTLIQRYAVWGIGGRAARSGRSGGLAGTRSYAVSMDDGVDFACSFNTRYFPLGDGEKALDALLGEIRAILNATSISR